MAFDQSAMLSVNDQPYGNQIYLSWAASVAAGTWFQVYVNGHLYDHTQANSMLIPMPSPGNTDRIDVGYVASLWGGDPWGSFAWGSAYGMETVDYSADLPTPPARRVVLSWLGGLFESPDLAGFYVYGSPVDGTVDYTTALATITAYPAGIVISGWGHGAWGTFPWGYGTSSYSWTSDTLSNGVWTWAVVPFDSAGNQGTPATYVTTIAVPPTEPPTFPNSQVRLHYTIVNPGGPEVVLDWLPSHD